MGNLAALSAAYVLLLAVYQDWFPLVAALIGSLTLPALAIISPESLDAWKAFQREAPGTGAWVRVIGIFMAAGVVS